MSSRLIFSIIFLTSCIYKEDAPVQYVDASNETNVAINPTCSFDNLVSMVGLLSNEKITNIRGISSSVFTVTGTTGNSTNSDFDMSFNYSRPKKNVIYTYTNGEKNPDNLHWVWEIRSQMYLPYNGQLFIEVLQDKKIKFTWCNLTFKKTSLSGTHLSQGSFILD